MLPNVFHGSEGDVVAGDGNGLRFGENVRIAGVHFLQRVRSDLDILEVRLTIGAGGGGDVHGGSLVTGAVQPEGKAGPAAVYAF